jgi:hypothetical protein
MKLMVELITSKQIIPTKSCQSGGFPLPFANAIAMIAAASITHDRGFHMNPKNLRNLLSCSLKCLSLVHKSAYNMKYSLSSIGQCLNRDLFLFQFVGAKDLNPAGSFL